MEPPNKNDDPRGESWMEYRRWVYDQLTILRAEVWKQHDEILILKTKAAVYGGGVAFIVSVIMWFIKKG